MMSRVVGKAPISETGSVSSGSVRADVCVDEMELATNEVIRMEYEELDTNIDITFNIFCSPRISPRILCQ